MVILRFIHVAGMYQGSSSVCCSVVGYTTMSGIVFLLINFWVGFLFGTVKVAIIFMEKSLGILLISPEQRFRTRN